MPESCEIHVVPRNQRWEVSTNGVTRRLIDWLCTKERAIDHAIERAAELGVPEAHVSVFGVDRSVEEEFVVDDGSRRSRTVGVPRTERDRPSAIRLVYAHGREDVGRARRGFASSHVGR